MREWEREDAVGEMSMAIIAHHCTTMYFLSRRSRWFAHCKKYMSVWQGEGVEGERARKIYTYSTMSLLASPISHGREGLGGGEQDTRQSREESEWGAMGREKSTERKNKCVVGGRGKSKSFDSMASDESRSDKRQDHPPNSVSDSNFTLQLAPVLSPDNGNLDQENVFISLVFNACVCNSEP